MHSVHQPTNSIQKLELKHISTYEDGKKIEKER
jgi:hypothetical protein